MSVDEWINEHGVTVLPPCEIRYRTGSLRAHLLSLLQNGAKTQKELVQYFGSSKEVSSAIKSLRAVTKVYYKLGYYSLESDDEK